MTHRFRGWPLLFLALSCGDGAPGDGERPTAEHDAAARLYHLRNQGKLHGDRDTVEGYDEAVRVLEEVIELSPDDFLDHLNLLRASLFATARPENLDEHVARALELAPGDRARGALDYVVGLHLYETDRIEEAVEHFATAQELAPQLVNTWYWHGYLLDELDRPQEAATVLREALERWPDDRSCTHRLSRVMLKLGEDEEWERLAARVADLPEASALDKCALTRLERVPHDRSEHEPPRVVFRWHSVAEELLPDLTDGRLVVDGRERAVQGVEPLDVDYDGAPDLLLLTEAEPLLYVSTGGELRRQELPAGVGSASAAAVGDLDNDGRPDIVLSDGDETRLLASSEEGEYRVETPFDGLGAASAMRLFDLDHDGDLDLLGVSGGGVFLQRNNGEPEEGAEPDFRRFTALDTFADWECRADARFDAHDLDQGNDLDLVLAGGEGGIGIAAFLNLRDGTFSTAPQPALGERPAVLVEDFDNDGAPDVLAYGGSPGWSLAGNADRSGEPRRARFGSPAANAPGFQHTIADAVVCDLDNDADVDVLCATDAGVGVLRNSRAGRLEWEAVELPDVNGAARAVRAVDLDGDGHLEALACTADGRLALLASGATQYAGWRARPYGQKDNHGCVGAVVEQYSARLFQSAMIKGPLGIHLGSGRASNDEVDGHYWRWPQGIREGVVQPKIAEGEREIRFQQKGGPVASCPFLYVRGPDGWSFLTDVVAIAPLDEWLPPGLEPHLDPQELVRIPGDALTVVDGRLQVAITEELRELTYLDGVELVVVEHAAGHELHADESTRQGKYDELSVHVVASDELSPSSSVRVTRGRDVPPAEATRLLAQADRGYLHAYEEAPTQWSGWVRPFDIELLAPANAGLMILTGRIAWYDSTVAYALHQNGRGWGPFGLHARDGAGRLQELVSDLGVPAGMDRNMVVELPAQETERVLVLNGRHRFLWDRVLFAPASERVTLEGEAGEHLLRSGADETSLRYWTLRPSEAVLEYHGFSKQVGSREDHEVRFLFDEAGPDESFPRPTGMATRYGDVVPLIETHDDRVVVLVPGDRVMISFEAPSPPEPERARTYFLRVSGWAKESGFHNSTGRDIDPLPFRAMESYPPDEARAGVEYERYLEQYQTRRIRW